jgi:hypothetical protein
MHAPRIIAALAGGASLLAWIAGCSSPTKPSVSVASARPVSPASGTQVVYNTQPVKLLVDNGAATGGILPGDTFEVATDPTFTTLVVSKSVPQSASGQTSLMLDPLAPATYYWRVRAVANDATVTSPTFTLKVVLPVPALVSPASGTQVEYHTQPVKLLVDNGVATGGVLVGDTFEVATDAAFATLVLSKSLPQAASGQTTLMLDPLAPATYYWRVRAAASDATMTSPTFTFHIAVALPAPVLLSPASGVLIGSLNQPVTLVVQNPAASPSVTGVTNSFDVATDQAFANIVVSKAILQSATGPTVFVVDPLLPSATYYWRARVTATDAIGATSATASFRIGPAIISGPYRLTLTAPCWFTIFGRQVQIQHVFDGQLSRRDRDAGIFFAIGGGDLTLGATLSGNRVAGSLSSITGSTPTFAITSDGEVNCRDCHYFIVLARDSRDFSQYPIRGTPVALSGSVDPETGHILASFDGSMRTEAFWTGGAGVCSGTFPVSLVPR